MNGGIHHINYPQASGKGKQEDLIALCDRCHEEILKLKGGNK